jgi:hypothetical protein
VDDDGQVHAVCKETLPNRAAASSYPGHLQVMGHPLLSRRGRPVHLWSRRRGTDPGNGGDWQRIPWSAPKLTSTAAS